MDICPDCNGEGFIVTCCDDICNGIGYCMHGDGEETCSYCQGMGEVPTAEDDDGGYSDWLVDQDLYRTEERFDVHEMAKAIVKMTWILSPVIVALVAFNFWRMIQEEVERK